MDILNGFAVCSSLETLLVCEEFLPVLREGHFGFLMEFLPTEEDYSEEDRERVIAEILESETFDSSNLRLSNELSITDELIFNQERDIETCFRHVNYLRAELASLCEDKKKHVLEKNYIARYAHASYKELAARKSYATLAMAAATDRAKLKSSDIMESNWKRRIHNDIRVKQEYKTILNTQDLTFKLRKKFDWEYTRAKSILASDMAAFKAAWPEGDLDLVFKTPNKKSDTVHSDTSLSHF